MTVYSFDATQRRHGLALADSGVPVVDLLGPSVTVSFSPSDVVLFHWTHFHEEDSDKQLLAADTEFDLDDENSPDFCSRFQTVLAYVRPLLRSPSDQRPAFVFYSGRSPCNLPTAGPEALRKCYVNADLQRVTFFDKTVPREGPTELANLIRVAASEREHATEVASADDVACAFLALDALRELATSPVANQGVLIRDLVGLLGALPLTQVSPQDVPKEEYAYLFAGVQQAKSLATAEMDDVLKWVVSGRSQSEGPTQGS